METGSSQRTQHSETDQDVRHGHEMRAQPGSWQSNHREVDHESAGMCDAVRDAKRLEQRRLAARGAIERTPGPARRRL